jgi:CheY-like chemotaxis protein
MAPLHVLVADDDSVSRIVVAAILKKAGYAVVMAKDGHEAWAHLSGETPPAIAVLDWMMPGLDGPEILTRLRQTGTSTPVYVILVTSRDSSDDIVTGLKAGANDYVTKPANPDELVARVNVGARVVDLQRALADRVRSLEEALSNVKTLQGLLPMCSYCKAIRDDRNYWQRVETYLHDHSGVQFSHSYCPTCYERYVRPELEAAEQVIEGTRRQTGR